MITVPTWLPLAAFLVLTASSVARIAGLQRHGVNALAVRAGDDAHAFLGRVFAILIVVTLLFCAAYAVRPTEAAALGSLEWIRGNTVGWVGAVLTIAGVLLAVVAQFGMGQSWRIGVRESDESALVSDGIYRFSRNPIYFGMMAAMVGILLIAPNALTLMLTASAWITTSAQIRLEEDFLSRKHGDEYEGYRARTRRWL